jgi:bifunctional UDP-N-acetylglucosamine pyrophosphorylase/glucosamine-1-phosphate N-acetyltransferase
MSLRAIVLAAGQGTRMQSDMPKVLYEVAGRPLVAWVVDAVGTVNPDEIVVVVGHGAELVQEVLPEGVTTVTQPEQLGTGHAVMVALDAMGDVSGDAILVVPGDTPLLPPRSLSALLEEHAKGASATVLTTVMPDPTGYGRVIRYGDRVVGIVEESDADEEQQRIGEVAVSTYVFDGDALSVALGEIRADNEQAEYYLTDAIGALAAPGMVRAVAAAEPSDVLGVNSHDQLAVVAAHMRRRINESWMRSGVWMQDPDRTYIDAGVTLEAGVRIYADTQLCGGTKVAAGAELGPHVFAVDSDIGPGARVWYSVLRGAEVGEGAQVGPFASLRPGTVMAPGSKVGTFVETKEAKIGPGSKVPHLSYMGDVTIGEGTNVGAGSITCNYDGREKHSTVIGDRAFIGSDTMLVAPVEVGDDAYTGAGSTITKDVAPGSLAVERSQQREIRGYAAKKKKKRRRKGG